jgi:hypothetical protein
MMNTDRAEQGLLRLLRTLEPYADDIVLVGGWVPFVYARHLDLADRVPLFTRDIDLAVPRRLATRQRGVDAILKDAGLDLHFKSLQVPPSVSYTGALDGVEVEVEFLTAEPGNREGPREVQPGLSATGLHYVELLTEASLAIDVVLAGEPTRVRVPSPASFIVQKGLVFLRRPRLEKRAKDLYYIFEVWEGCAAWRAWIESDLEALGTRRATWVTRCAQNLAAAIGQPDCPGIRMLVEQRPAAAFPDLDDDQFGQYAWGALESLRVALER